MCVEAQSQYMYSVTELIILTRGSSEDLCENKDQRRGET